MKRTLASISILLLFIFSLSGCNAIGEKTASLTIVYGTTAIVSLILFLFYFCAVKKKNIWFVTMFSSVLVVNIGYYCLAISSSLEEALNANRFAYLGSVLLPMAMLMIILNVTNTQYKKFLPWCLLLISAVVLFIAASPGYLEIYYKEVSFEVIDGVATLVKVYGPLHPIYLFYLLGYFAAMITIIARAQIKKTIDTTSHAIIIAVAVFVNIGVWFIEQLVSINFEMLSVSYIISELFLLGVNLIMHENQRLREIIRQKEEDKAPANRINKRINNPVSFDQIDKSTTQLFIDGYKTLTPKELELFNAYIAGQSTKEILVALNIKENTLKYHSKNLYSKLGVNSRKQLTAIYTHISVSENIDKVQISAQKQVESE